MMRRREVVGSGMLAGLAALVSPEESGASPVRRQDDNNAAIVRAIDDLRQALERQASGCSPGICGAVEYVRAQQKTFLRANQKFPDYIDAGIDAWCELYDWHVRNRQPIETPNFIGWGYDGR
jgi:hypothetical protein